MHYAIDLGWQPHKPETWTARYATLVRPVTMRYWRGHGSEDQIVDCPAGTRVKIVMVSRFGDVGITEKLDANGYGARVYLDDLEQLSMES